MQLQPYLYFGGSCAKALELYKTAFGGSAEIMHFKDAPPNATGAGDFDPEGVMHASFTAPGIAFMASDGRPGTTYTGGNVSLAIAGDVEDGKRIFDILAEGATDVQPFEKMFWGAHFGQLTDRFGIDWMFNCG